jgi:hypothetical protein
MIVLVAFAQEPQIVFGTADMVFGRPPDPIVVRMVDCAVAHHADERFERFGE